MNNLAIIPARGGSVRIPKKNIKDFFGKPVITYPIETALNSGLFDIVMVSTDSQEVSLIAQEYGATVPFLRSEINSNNFATLSDVIIEVIQEYKAHNVQFNSVCCILSTAALLSQKRLIQAYEQFKENDFDSVVPVVQFSYPIQRALKDNDGLLQMREPEYLTSRSQDLESFYHDSGQFYWIKTEAILREKSIFMANTGYVELDEMEVQDVDSQIDWEMLSMKFKFKNIKI